MKFANSRTNADIMLRGSYALAQETLLFIHKALDIQCGKVKEDSGLIKRQIKSAREVAGISSNWEKHLQFFSR